MDTTKLDPKTKKKLLAAQKTEITEHFIYARLAQRVKTEKSRKILRQISVDELKHHDLCNDFTCQLIKPNWIKVWFYYAIARIFGITFGLKLMERREEKAHDVYAELSSEIPEAVEIVLDEEKHGKELLNLIDDERLDYSSDIVRGLTAALVELSGSLAGFTFALQEKPLILTAGVIVGVTTSLSITATEYLGTKSSTSIKDPFKSALYAGLANICTSILLLLPYFLADNIYLALGLMIAAAIVIVFVFSFNLSVVRDKSTLLLFIEMSAVSLGIAALAFVIGFVAREFLHIHI